MTLLAGFAGGLAGTLWGGIVSPLLLLRARAAQPDAWQPDTAARLIAGAAVYGACGVAAGFLFWLGWGLVALVSTPWPLLGLLYGSLLWIAGAMPLVGIACLRLKYPRHTLWVLALEGCVASVSIGLLCAYVWHRAA